ncbi:MAG: hypothetical protein WBH99_12290 [Azovibrio sp.]|uniref:hypothetical protein n=1 Tax=Azovibrio sp. TaxID=1872673 RepID=UPI003C74DA50
MTPLVFAVLAVFVLALITGASGWLSPVAAFHLLVAAGVLPLICGAMLHFVPVLTRTGAPHRFFQVLPWLAQGLGLGVVLALQEPGLRCLLHPLSALLAGLALALIFWMKSRAKACLGTPHPGWRWYGCSLACLLLALLVVPLLLAVPAAYRPLRSLHLHLNTLGFVGLAALGTLPLLLPTALGQHDPDARHWLRRYLWPVLGSVLVLTGGTALAALDGMALVGPLLAAVGLVLLVYPVLRLLVHWQRRFGFSSLWRDGATASLLLAVPGFMLLQLAGLLHGFQRLEPRLAILALGPAFLLPLVLGALSQLLPVWCHPGPATPNRLALRQRLAAGGAGRALLFLGAACAILLGHELPGMGLVGLGLGHFLLALVAGLLQSLPGSERAR